MSAGHYVAVVGAVICAVAATGSALSVRSMRGTSAGVAFSAACLALAVVGLAAALSGVLVSMGYVR